MLACHLRLEARPKYLGMIINFCFGGGIGSRHTPELIFLGVSSEEYKRFWRHPKIVHLVI